jgi:aminopeptidase N
MTIKHQITYLKNYQISDFLIGQVDLHFDVFAKKTIVKSSLQIKRNGKHNRPLILNGEELDLLAISLDEKPLFKASYQVTAKHLIISKVPDDFSLQIAVCIKPHLNKQLSGLYISKKIYCTQCESEGFRRITYFIDRPDVMSKFTTTICADCKQYPVLLSNGDLINYQQLPNDRHSATWRDPSLKPCYLFALVAGDLAHVEDQFVTKSKQKVKLKIYTEKEQVNKCAFAMQSLKQSMLWDEKVFGCEYDLKTYMIVAISDFNFGAMENKGLNIFTARRIIANPETATDEDYLSIARTVGHEYFHNWTGNRITCRDWFQISLKEGLTEFREQLFSATLTSEGVQRIRDANLILASQFPEDASPFSHPVQPKSYIEIGNFYTLTVYYKGAELIRMLYTILGAKKFFQGMQIYLTRYDGMAVAIEDFIMAMQEASSIDLTLFKKWYDVAGTPILTIKSKYNSKAKTLQLTVKSNKALHIPLAVGLLDQQGNELNLQLADQSKNEKVTTRVLSIKGKQESFTFINIKQKPVLSLLRDFSAPIKINYQYSNEDLLFLMVKDPNAFSRWHAGQQLMINLILELISKYQKYKPLQLNQAFFDALLSTLNDPKIDDAFKAMLLALPSQTYLMELMAKVDIDAIHYVYEFMSTKIAEHLRGELLNGYQLRAKDNDTKIDYQSVGKRALKNLCLFYLTHLNNDAVVKLGARQFTKAKNMTDVVGSLRALIDLDVPMREQLLTQFYKKWQHDDLVISKWLELQAMSKLPSTLSRIKSLLKHPIFKLENPDKVYALIRTFCRANNVLFHAKNGSGYKFLADQVLALDKINPHIAANLVGPLLHWQKFDVKRQILMRKQLQRIKKTPKLSKNVFEIVAR